MRVPFAVVLLGLGACSLRGTFIQLSYPVNGPDEWAETDRRHHVAALLLPILVTDYDDPRGAAACLGTLASDAGAVSTIRSYGQCLDARTLERHAASDANACLDAVAPALRRWADQLCPTLGVDDRVRLFTAFLDAGDAVAGYQVAVSAHRWAPERGTVDADGAAAIEDGLQAGLAAAVEILRNDPAAPYLAGGPNRPDLPALSLSGGAGNGAFLAGYLYAMLGVRDQVIEDQRKAGGPPASIPFEDRARFAGAAATSVGTLVALAVDLYFSGGDQARGLGRDQLRHRFGLPPDQLAPPGVREVEGKQFATEEPTLLCARRGIPLQIIGLFDPPLDSALRFDPLEAIVRKQFSDHGRAMLADPFVRVHMAVEARQNVLVPLDERVCRGLSDASEQQECSVAAVMASVSEPTFAPAVPKVWDGIDAGGTIGSWIDGGLRSGSPTVQAAGLAHARVLSINTNRLEGVPTAGFEHGGDILFHSIDNFTDQTRAWEIGYTDLMFGSRDRYRCTVRDLVGASTALAGTCETALAADPSATRVASAVPPSRAWAVGGPGPSPSDNVLAVFVPADITSGLFAAGYAFDPEVMHGLFLWGQKSWYESNDRVVTWLGWPEEMKTTNAGTRAHIERELENVQGEIDAREPEWSSMEWWKKHRAERRWRLSWPTTGLQRCED